MKPLPASLLQSLTGIKGYDPGAFKDIHASGAQVTSIRINPLKTSRPLTQNSALAVPWTQYGFYLNERPSFTFDPLFHAGCYYVQEASSMFLEQALKQTTDLSQPLKVLDLCAAPGGKSTHIQSLISADSLLLSNEVIRGRANILKDNMIKWGAVNVVVTNNDPKDFSKLENYFDVIVIDAPCSGSGLFRRDPEAIDEWSENNVALCSQRQQRILADAWPALKKGGVLIYSTCSYSKEEDEDMLDWLMKEKEAETCMLDIPDEWNIVAVQGQTGAEGYRFWPDKVKGEGFFIAAFRKKEGESSTVFRIRQRPLACTKNEIAIASGWINSEEQYFIKHETTVYAWPAQLQNDFTYILEQMKVIYSGILVGELMRDKLVPDHALAMSVLVKDTIGKADLDKEDAICYLQRKDLQPGTKNTGWQLANYLGYSLGWMNVLPNRINNYYPRQLRILKDF